MWSMSSYNFSLLSKFEFFSSSLQRNHLARFLHLSLTNQNLHYRARPPLTNLHTAQAPSRAKANQPIRNLRCPFHPTTTPYLYLCPPNRTPYLPRRYVLLHQRREKRHPIPPRSTSPRLLQRGPSIQCTPSRALMGRVTKDKAHWPDHNLDVSTGTSHDSQNNLFLAEECLEMLRCFIQFFHTYNPNLVTFWTLKAFI